MKKKFVWILTGLLAIFAFFLLSAPENASAAPLAYNQIRRGNVAPNVYLMSENLGGLTKKQATAKIKDLKTLLNHLLIRTRVEDDNKTLDLDFEDLGLTYSVESVTKSMEENLLRGNLIDRYFQVKNNSSKKITLDCGLNLSEDEAYAIISDKLASWNREAKNASATMRSGSLVFQESEDGYVCDFKQASKDLAKAIQSGEFLKNKYELKINAGVTKAEITSEQLRGLTVIGSMTTSYPEPHSDVSRNREQNLITSTSHMSGRLFKPGDIISALNLYGEVSYANGYAAAGTIVGETHMDQIGGGICQTTTTLYNAVLAAELTVTYRNNHSHMINYVEPGRDAMVYAQGGRDFKFRNSTDGYLLIDAYVNTKDCTITVNLIGKELHSPNHRVEYRSDVYEYIAPQVTDVIDFELPIGFYEEKVLKKVILPESDLAYGCRARLYKRVSEDGGQTWNETLYTDEGVSAVSSYQPYAMTVTHSADLDVEIYNNEDYRSCFIGIETTYHGTDVIYADNVHPDHDAEWRKEFNLTMQENMKEFNLEWPDKGSNASMNGELMEPFYDPEPFQESESSSESEISE